MAAPDAHTPPHPFPAALAALVATFAANEADYTTPEFKEAQVRQQFLDRHR